MLKLENIVKVYGNDENAVKALKGVSLEFRKSEFVSILGESGCGKTTLLNIIGGLDRYTSGDLYVAGKSTKSFKDGDWDAYRNNSIGFIFQSYNLINHQTVLANVEMALTLAGISPKERRRRATEALEKVGLGRKLKKLPNQLSGGQMQRVAIARALINDPEIILADEPTGALDSETSVQVMELLKEIAKDRLVIMVTHNGDLAEKYSTRIIRLSDGEVIADNNPLDEGDKEELEKAIEIRKQKIKDKKSKTAMDFMTAVALSLKNLLTKKARTILTAFAGSIGIIGVALVLAVSSGVTGYINRLQKDTLSSYPMTISADSFDTASLITTVMNTQQNVYGEKFPNERKIFISTMLTQLGEKIMQSNDVDNAKKVIDERVDKDLYYAIQEDYGVDLDIYVKSDIAGTDEGYFRSESSFASISEMVESVELLSSQYDLIEGTWPRNEVYEEDGVMKAEMVLIVDQYNQISDIAALLLLGDGNEMNFGLQRELNFEDVLSKQFLAIVNDAIYKENNGVYHKAEEKYSPKPLEKVFEANPIYYQLASFYKVEEDVYNNKENVQVKISGIIRLNKQTELGTISSTLAYTKGLADYMRESAKNSAVVKAQQNSEISVVEGKTVTEMKTVDDIIEDLGYSTNIRKLSIFAKDFKSKEEIKRVLDDYNNSLGEEEGNLSVNYSDLMQAMMGMLTKFIDIVTYALVGFTAISLVVSSIMIGIITYISVLERTKEIGILRAIGARKKDIRRVFNAESGIIGFTAGIIGILIALFVALIMNLILTPLTGVSGLVYLKPLDAIILVIVSMALTLISGSIPSVIAAKRDPVTALRTE